MTSAFETSLIKCSQCSALLSPEQFNFGELLPCPSCRALLDVQVFPAILTAPTATPVENILVEGESSCFYHPTKRASVVCDNCGRFLCGLCDLELNGRHVCPVCLDSGQKKAKFKDLENSRMLWDSITLAVALAPILIFWLTIISAPVALYLAIRHRKDPGSITGRWRWRLYLGGIIAVMEIAGWVLFFSYFFFVPHHHRHL